ncbi:type II toxin-antitoxin system HicB family antitoxin [Methanosarcina sp. MSH10X1]|uniref:type II toxin-antitoxin system HicB family antitoxin n=1 Tax=Methanosarcina sp. MSH10X1 TaxID=2507075 RepID=UPI000FFC2D0C|nr:type II toxin-antitoxin system HicB family antitoxin [Methanosarcina sp. MSH10X1]
MKFKVWLQKSDEGGYTAQCLEIPAAISEGKTKEEALDNIKEAIELVLEFTGGEVQVHGEVVTVDVSFL